MVGDGLNDAGALQQADIGIAVTENTTAFSPASDAILDAGSFSRLFDLIAFSKVSRKIIIISFIISFLYNIFGLAYAVTGNLTPILAAILMPLSSISVVGFTTFAVHLMAKFKKLSVIIILIIASILVALGFLIAFIWAVKSGQYDDTYSPSVRILFEDEQKKGSENKKNEKS